jgi:hypothetical protein
MAIILSLVVRIALYTTNLSIAAGNMWAAFMLLARNVPATATALQLRLLRELEKEAKNVQALLSTREAASAARVFEPRLALINAWFAVYDALNAASRLPGDKKDRGPRSGALRDVIFPAGTDFSSDDANTVLGASDNILNRIEADDVKEQLDQLIAKDFIIAARKAHEALGDAIVAQSAANNEAPLVEAKQAFMDSLFDYTRSLAGDVRHDDQESIDRFFSAVSCLDSVRITRANGNDEDDDEGNDEDETDPTPTDPTPTPSDPTPAPQS